MPVYRVGNNTYVSRLQHAGTTPSNAGGAANTANATFGRVRPAVLLEEEREQPLDFIFVDVGSGATQLVIDDASHAHAADNLALTQHNVLVIQDASHGHTADNVALTQHNVLAIQDATHGHTADNVVLGVGLVIQDAAHDHVADNLALTQHNVLAIADALHAHAADNVALTQHNVLVIQDALHGHAADNVALTQHNVLAVQDALHAHAADNVVLTAHDPSGFVLVIQDGAHAHSAENLALQQHAILAIADALHAHIAPSGSLIPGDGPAGYWRMHDASGDLQAAAGGKPLTPSGSGFTYQADGQDGTAVTFAGAGKFQAPAASDFAFSTGTIEAWIKTTDAGTSYRGIVTKQLAYGMFFRDNRFIIHDWAGGGDKDTAYFPNDGKWHHVAQVFDMGVANGSHVYLDGVDVLTYTHASGANQTITLQVGDGNASQFWNGTIDEVAVYSTKLTPTQIANHAARPGLTLTQHNVLAIDDAFHAHTADHINDIGGDPGTIEQEDIVRLRRRRQPIGT